MKCKFIIIALLCTINYFIPNAQSFTIDSNMLEQSSFKVVSISSVATDKKDNIYILHRGDRMWNKKYADRKDPITQPVILKYSKEGKLIDSFGKDMFIMPHMININNKGNMWVADVWLQQVIIMDKRGKVLLTLGEKLIPGTDSLHFDLPADIAVLKNNSFYVSDGYGNSRIIKYSKDGALEFEWGKRGKEKGDFHTPHSIAVFKNKVFVADRENSRLQIFDLKGKFIEQLDVQEKLGRLTALTIDKKGNLYMTGDKATSMLSSKLQELHTWHEKGHDIAVDAKGVIYIVSGSRFRRISPVTAK